MTHALSDLTCFYDHFCNHISLKKRDVTRKNIKVIQLKYKGITILDSYKKEKNSLENYLFDSKNITDSNMLIFILLSRKYGG